MSEAEWSSDVGELAAPPKKRIPGWVWGCGAGCLLSWGSSAWESR